MVAGTAFGTVLIWSSQPDRRRGDLPNVVEVNPGHKGITFGVDQCEEWLASCSDDRGIRLGLIDVNASSDAVVSVLGPLSEQLSGIRNTPQVWLDDLYTNLGEKWSHNSRVWDVKFIKISSDALGLVSIGEDAVCQIQQIERSGLIQLVNDHYHSGKNIWSLTHGRLGGHQIITGGADGAIVSRAISAQIFSNGADAQTFTRLPPKVLGSHFDHYQSAFTPLFLKLDISPVSKNGSKAKPPSIKQYLFVSHSCLLALTDSGHLLRAAYEEKAPTENDQIDSYDKCTGAYAPPVSLEWCTVRNGNAFGSRPVLSNSQDHLAFLGNEHGDLFIFLPADEGAVKLVARLDIPISWLTIAGFKDIFGHSSECCVIVFSEDNKVAKAVWIQIPRDVEHKGRVPVHMHAVQHTSDRLQSTGSPTQPIDASVHSIDLPETFVPTSAYVLRSTHALVLGSRQSAVAIYRPLNDGEGTYRSPQCDRHIHGDDTITSVSGISSFANDHEGCRREFILTTGRNGTYAVHSIDLEESRSEYSPLDEKTLAFETLDTSTSLFSSTIEGSYCAVELEPVFRPSEGFPRLNFWFREFESDGRDRSGDLILYGFNSKKFVVWNESHQSLVFTIDCANEHRPWAYNTYAPDIPDARLSLPHHGPFAWTQAGSLNIVSIGQAEHFTLQQGGHGREIKALSVSRQPFRDLRHGIRSGILIATGAEDTTIRFFTIGATKESHAHNQMICIRTVKKHTTGLQHLCFSSCGKYLFSSGGCEEFYAWRIRHSVPGVNLGVVLDFTFPKESDKSDLRITDFSVRDQGSRHFVISAVYSSSMIKIFRYSIGTGTSKSTCELLRRVFYQDRCLTQINDYGAFGTLTASTDGHLAHWYPQDGLRPNRRLVHQNSIKVMQTITLPLTSESQLHQLVVTGGDDNDLGLTLMRTFISQTTIPRFQSLVIPKAHAAAITAICILPTIPSSRNNPSSHSQEFFLRFLSTSNDQRVKLWSVIVNLDKIGAPGSEIGGEAMAALDVELLASTGTSVADVGAMELVSELEKEGDARRDPETGRRYEPKPLTPEMERTARVLLVGVGMEVLQFKL